MKICIKCNKEKLATAFERHGTGKPRRNVCRECRNARNVYLKSLRRDEINEMQKKSYYKHRARVLRTLKRYRKNNPHIIKAHQALNEAVKLKKIKKLPCEVCGSEYRIHGHHDDYTKPLDVIWLCPKHHKERHKLLDIKNEAA